MFKNTQRRHDWSYEIIVIEEYGVFAILKISPGPSFPKRGLIVFTEKSKEP
jgi:hypothetical protein